MERSNPQQRLGVHGEDVAVAALEQAGMTVLARNWRCRSGELDVVALEPSGAGSTLVFCEVKTRRGLGYGSPAEAITHAKLARLRRLAAEWISTEWLATGRPRPEHLRIDVVGVLLLPGRGPEITHLRAVG
jgi:putative endonuclease